MNETWWVKPSQLDSKQGAVIDLDLGKSHLLLGPPGSGKTNLLLMRASQMVRSNKPNVLILIFTRELREFIATGTENYAFAADKITTSIGWMRSFLWDHGVKPEAREKFDELRAELTRQVKEVIQRANISNVYDAIILDEAQDYLPDELDIFLQLGAVVFAAADSRQRIYTSASYDLKSLEAKLGAVYHLKHHYRNGREICRLADALAKPWGNLEPLLPTCNYDEARNPSSVETVLCASLEEQVQKAVQKLETQLKAYPDEMLAVLCPSRKSLKAITQLLSQTSVAEKLVVQSAEDGYTAFDETKQVCVSTIYGAKGLEFRAVHLMQAELIKKSQLNRNIAYTAVTRAKTSLSIHHTDPLPGYIESSLSAMKEPVKPAKLNQLFEGS